MSKKHCEAVAEIIREHTDDKTDLHRRELAYTLAIRLAEWFQEDNERFDRKRFLVACGIDP